MAKEQTSTWVNGQVYVSKFLFLHVSGARSLQSIASQFKYRTFEFFNSLLNDMRWTYEKLRGKEIQFGPGTWGTFPSEIIESKRGM